MLGPLEREERIHISDTDSEEELLMGSMHTVMSERKMGKELTNTTLVIQS